MADSDSNDRDDQDFDIDFVGIIRRRYFQILFGVLVGVTGAVIFYFRQTPVYEAKLSVLVGQRSSELARTGASHDAETTVQDEILSTHMELFGSQKILEDAAKKSAMVLSGGSLSITKGGDGMARSASILKATYRSQNPQHAANVLQAIYDSYKAYIDEKSKNVGSEAAEIISESLTQSEASLQAAEKAYRDCLAEIPALVNTSGGLEDVHRLRLRSIESELSELRRDLSQAESRYSVIQEFAKGKDLKVLTDVEVLSLLDEKEVSRLSTFMNIANRRDSIADDQLQETSRASVAFELQRLSTLLVRRDKLQAAFGTRHPTYQGVMKEIESLQRYVNELRARVSSGEIQALVKPCDMLASYVKAMESDIAEFKAREKQLLELSEVEAREAKALETTFLLSNSLKADLDRARTRYDEIFSRLQEINLAANYTGFSTDLIVYPFASQFPVWPSKSKILTLGIVAGGLLGLGLALLAEFTDKTFKNPTDVEQVVGANVLAHLPRLELSKLTKISTQKDLPIRPSIVAFHAPRGSIAETFRVLRTSVLFLAKRDNKQIWMITSPSPGDGKSTAIANLAVSLAQTGKRVLLVDGDLRRPTVAMSFGLNADPGLTDYLKGAAKFEDCCRTSPQDCLTICPAGKATSSPAELLESHKLVEFLQKARESFELILIDAPPVLAVADPSIIAAHADACLVTVRIQRNNRSLVERTVEILTEQGVKPDGVIVNGRDSEKSHYGYSSYSYYGSQNYGYVKSYRNYYEVPDENGNESVVKN